jgi:transposase
MHFIGLDVGKEKLHAAWLRDAAKLMTRPKAVGNTADGYAQLLAWAERQTGQAAGELCFVLEATSVYHDAVALYLHQAGCRVCVLNPLHVKRYSESCGIKTKNDQHDARLLARFGHERQPLAWQPPALPVRHLTVLLKRLEALEKDQQRERNRLEKYEIEDVPAAVLASVRGMITTLEQEITVLQQRIEEHIDGHPELKKERQLLETVPGIGPKLSAWFLALFGTKDFRSGKQAAAFIGLFPTERQSGTSVRGHPALAKNGDGRWRARLYWPTMSATRFNPDIRVFYQRLLARGKCGKSALCAAMRKLVHMAFGILKHGLPYAPQGA